MMASVLAKEIVNKWYPGQKGDTLPNIIDTHLVTVFELIERITKCKCQCSPEDLSTCIVCTADRLVMEMDPKMDELVVRNPTPPVKQEGDDA